jgi:hypothetical protein
LVTVKYSFQGLRRLSGFATTSAVKMRSKESLLAARQPVY